MTNWIAAPPPPETTSATARVHLRYEDISQDGRLLLEVMPNALGASVWGAQLARDPLAQECLRSGIVPVLTRFVMEGTPGPFSVMTPMEATGRHVLAETDTGRVVVNMWAELKAPIGRTYPPFPADAGTIASAGRIFGEHVFTRLFAAPSARRVRREDLPGPPATLPRHVQRPFADMLDPALTPDEAPIVFGMVHTDSNQHVNSLVYLRLFEEAALRRLGDAKLLSRRMEIAYRKPCFAGDRMRLHVRTLEQDGHPAAIVAIAPEGHPASAAHAAARILLA
jgi:hypothetical protein